MSRRAEGISLRAQRCHVGSVVWVSGRRSIRVVTAVANQGSVDANYVGLLQCTAASAHRRTDTRTAGPAHMPARLAGPAHMQASLGALPRCRRYASRSINSIL